MISVVIPTLNEEKLLPRLLKQLTIKVRRRFHLEVIVADGGSADQTLVIAKKFGTHLVTKHPDRSQTIAGGRNAGAWQARGDILVFIDADNFLADVNHFFSRIKEVMRGHNIVAATVKIEVDPAEQTGLDRFWSSFFNWLFFLENKIAGAGMGRGNCQIIKTSAFRQLGGYNETLSSAEDYDMFHRLIKIGKIINIHEVVVYESPRRFRKLGYTKVLWLWVLNSVMFFFTGRPWSKKWQRV